MFVFLIYNFYCDLGCVNTKPTEWVVGDDQKDLTKKEKSNYWRYKGFQLFNTCSTRPE